jgi:hypothetical protein
MSEVMSEARAAASLLFKQVAQVEASEGNELQKQP